MHFKTYHFKSLTSTQDKAKGFAREGLSNIVVISDIQTKGRGRFKRKWYSSKGGLWMSILLMPKDVQNLQYLTFAAAVSVAKSIKKSEKIATKLKWPNDVHYNGKKLCGILTEGIFGKKNYVIIGIGLNANQNKFPDKIKNIATSLRIIKNKIVDIGKLKENILREFFILYNEFYGKNKSKYILKLWKQSCDTLGKNVKVIAINSVLEGEAVDVDESCNLVLKTKNNKILKIIEGDIKVRY